MTSNAQTEARAIARLRETLGGIYPDDFRGDNLAVFLASEIEPQIEDETLDESGTWKQGAIDACDRVLDAIHAHYATALAAKDAELDDAKNHVAELEMERDRIISELNTLSTQIAEANKALENLERKLCAAEHGHTVNEVIANYREIRRGVQDARRVREAQGGGECLTPANG